MFESDIKERSVSISYTTGIAFLFFKKFPVELPSSLKQREIDLLPQRDRVFSMKTAYYKAVGLMF
jgi:hypothetical protein